MTERDQERGELGVRIASVLAELMKQRRINQTALSELSNVPQSTLSRILRGTHKTLELETACKLAECFQVSLDQLVGNDPLTKNP